MSSPVNGVNNYNCGYVYYRPCGYPSSTGPQSSHVHSVQPAHQQWDNCSPPPAYDTIDQLPTWNEDNSSLTTTSTTQIWIRRNENNSPSTSQVSSMPYGTPANSPELSGFSTFSHQNSYRVTPQTVDIKQWFRRYRPRVQGIILLIVPVLEFSLGISAAVSLYDSNLKSLQFGSLFWVPGFHVLAGVMLIVSWTNTSICSVTCVLCTSFLSFIASVFGLAFNSYDLHDLLCVSSSHFLFCRIIYEREYKLYCFLIALNILALVLSFFASCIGNVALGLRRRSSVYVTERHSDDEMEQNDNNTIT